jgi:hypothetical protein
MSTRYPDLNEPVVTPIGKFAVIAPNTGEFVECCYCFAAMRKERAKGHAGVHKREADVRDEHTRRITLLRKTLALLAVGVAPGIKWLDKKWEEQA